MNLSENMFPFNAFTKVYNICNTLQNKKQVLIKIIPNIYVGLQYGNTTGVRFFIMIDKKQLVVYYNQKAKAGYDTLICFLCLVDVDFY